MKLTKKQLANVAASSSFCQEFKFELWNNIKFITTQGGIIPEEKELDEIAMKLWNKYFKRKVKVSVFKRKKQ